MKIHNQVNLVTSCLFSSLRFDTKQQSTMSVRNRYASTVTKVAPISPSSRLVAESRITSKKLDDMVRSKYMGRNADYYTKFSRNKSKKKNDIPNSSKLTSNNVNDKIAPSSALSKKSETAKNHKKPPPNKAETRLDNASLSSGSSDSSSKGQLSCTNAKPKTSRTVEVNTKITFDKAEKGPTYYKTTVARRHSETRYDTFPERREQTHELVKHTAQAASKLNANAFHYARNVQKEKIRRHSDSQCELRKNVSMSENHHPQTKPARPARERPKSFTDKEVFDEVIYRPKSARPSSRWERRFGDEISDDESDAGLYETKMLRPKSGRPDSILMRHTELVDERDFMRQPTPPPRPTTSRGRRNPEENKDFSDNYQRNISDPRANSSNSNNHVLSKTAQSENVKFSDRQDKSGQSITYDKSIHGFDPDSYRKEQIKVMNAKDMLDLNSGIDDIDLDIDPVVYFLQDDDSMTSRTYNPSLSKDVINIIGKASSEEHKPPIGYHSNTANKQRHKSDGYENFHGNEQQYPKSTFRGSDMSSHQNRHDGMKQKSKNKFKHHAYSYSDSSAQNVWQKSGIYDSVTDKVISKYSAPSSPFSDVSKHGFRPDSVYKAAFDQDDIILRKPRKLEPISGKYFPN